MKIDNCIRIIDGVLQTSPSIDAFERIVFESHRVLRGDCFIDVSNTSHATQEAIEKGAYAIISMRPFEGQDEEIAWIHVACVEQTLIKLLRYTITQKSLRCFIASCVQISFLEYIQSPKSIKTLKGSLQEYAVEVFKAKENDSFCLCDEKLALLIAPSAQKITLPLHVNPVFSKGLFISSFQYKTHYWHEQKIPALFVNAFVSVLAFCDEHSIAWHCDTIPLSEHFYPQFTTQSLRKKEFGTSDKVLIFESNHTLLEEEISYLQSQKDTTSLIVCLPKGYDVAFTCKSKILFYTQASDLNILKEHSFCYALILGEKEAFESLMSQTFTTQPTLF